MIDYICKIKNSKKYIDELELNNDRNGYLDKQTKNGNEPIIFCCCNDKYIPMTLTNHKPNHHFLTKSPSDGNNHYKFCKHYRDKNTKIGYKPAIIMDEEGNESALVSFKSEREVQEKIIDIEYIRLNTFKYNNKNIVIQGKMSFSAYIKYINAKYFHMNQYKKKNFEIESFNNSLSMYIKNYTVNNKKVSELGKGVFLYSAIKNYKEVNKKFYEIETMNGKYWIKKTLFDEAIKAFSDSYNNLNPASILSGIFKDSAYLILFGFKDVTSVNHPKYTNISLLLVNKYGLFSESKNEVEMYNVICNHILCKEISKDYVFYKPLLPENDYDNPNYISDGVIRNKNTNKKTIIEIFGRDEEEYLKRKVAKYNTCKHSHIFWDTLKKESFNQCLELLNEIR